MRAFRYTIIPSSSANLTSLSGPFLWLEGFLATLLTAHSIVFVICSCSFSILVLLLGTQLGFRARQSRERTRFLPINQSVLHLVCHAHPSFCLDDLPRRFARAFCPDEQSSSSQPDDHHVLVLADEATRLGSDYH